MKILGLLCYCRAGYEQNLAGFFFLNIQQLHKDYLALLVYDQIQVQFIFSFMLWKNFLAAIKKFGLLT